MTLASRIFCITLALTAWGVAALPQKAPLAKYAGLWNNSPFTSKPPPPPDTPGVNPLDDYSLAGVSPISSGYRVTLFNKKTPAERITVETGSTKNDFKILEVTRKSGSPLATVVRMQNGSNIGSISFDEKLLVLAAPPAAKAAAKPPGPAGSPPPVPVPVPAAQLSRTQRPRVVPPPQLGQSPSPSNPANPRTTRPAHHGDR